MASDALDSLLPRLRAALLAESRWMAGLPPIVAVRDLATLQGHWQTKRMAVRFTRLAERSDAIVQHGPVAPALWMKPEAAGYRDAYQCFLRAHWGCAAPLRGSGYDVDHVYNRARAIHYGYGYVRMLLVPAGANRAHGRGYEKGIGAAEARRQAKIMKLLDGMSELKIFGIPPLGGDGLLPEQLEAARAAAFHYRIPLAAALDTLRQLYRRAQG